MTTIHFRDLGTFKSFKDGIPVSDVLDTKTSPDEEDDVHGSTSASSYDRASVMLSDIVRFVLCHRFGGIYVDTDTLFLRDWEELFGSKQAFAYRWSRLDRVSMPFVLPSLNRLLILCLRSGTLQYFT